MTFNANQLGQKILSTPVNFKIIVRIGLDEDLKLVAVIVTMVCEFLGFM